MEITVAQSVALVSPESAGCFALYILAAERRCQVRGMAPPSATGVRALEARAVKASNSCELAVIVAWLLC